MTRVAAWLGLALGLLALWIGVNGTVGEAAGRADRLDLMAGGLAFMGFLVWRRGRAPGRYFYIAAALAILVTHLPLYFRGAGVWPHLALVGLGALTFGFGILGVVMDGVETRTDRG